MEKLEIQNTILPPTKIRVPIPDPHPRQPLELEIVRSKFVTKRIGMEREYKRLRKIAEKSKNDARVHEHKAQRMVKGYTKVKNKNENLYEVNKKL